MTKASGAAGGVVEKVMAAQDLGLKTLMIRRPAPAGLLTVSTPDAAVRLCQQLLQVIPTREGIS